MSASLPATLDLFRQEPPALAMEYTDPALGFRGWFVRHRLDHRLCAGGMRVAVGLTQAHVADMARNMTLKMRIAGLNVDGAKCGIDLDPRHPDKTAAMERFLAALAPYITTTYSLGPDLNVEMDELSAALGRLGIPSPKVAVARAQGWTTEYFGERSRLLAAKVFPHEPGWTLGRLRAGYGVAAAALAVLDHLGIPPSEARVAVQGCGQVGQGAVLVLARHGVRITAAGDAEKTVADPTGIDLRVITSAGRTGLLPEYGACLPREAVLAAACDLLLATAVEASITEDNAHHLRCRAVVPGANLAVTPGAARLLAAHNILVVPDFVAGCGGSLSMEGLYGPEHHPSPQAVLDHVAAKMRTLVADTITLARDQRLLPSEAAYRLCRQRPFHRELPPYIDCHGCPPN